MSNPQTGIVYRYFPLDVDHDVSADVVQASLDQTTWITLAYVQPVDYTPPVIAANANKPPQAGFTRYWWRTLTGPAQPLPLQRGVSVVYGKLTDNPEIPDFAWTVSVGQYE